MADWTGDDLGNQFQHAKVNGWLPYFEAAGTQHDFPVELLLGIASRETNMRNIRGDFHGGSYHGYGIMQVDIGTDPDFCRAWTADKVQESIQRGTEILAGKRQSLARKGITDLKAIAAAYNTGEGHVANSVAAGNHPDSTTTGGDYGADVLDRMAVFKGLLAPT